jgi:hypothetical protein
MFPVLNELSEMRYDWREANGRKGGELNNNHGVKRMERAIPKNKEMDSYITSLSALTDHVSDTTEEQRRVSGEDERPVYLAMTPRQETRLGVRTT